MGTSTIVVHSASEEEADVPPVAQENRADRSSTTSATEPRVQATQVTRTPSTSYERLGYRDASTSPGRPDGVETSVTAASQTDVRLVLTQEPSTLIGSVDPPPSTDNGQPFLLPLRRVPSIHSPVSAEPRFTRLSNEPPPPYPGLVRVSPSHCNRTALSNVAPYSNQNLLQHPTNGEQQIRMALYQSMRDLVRAHRQFFNPFLCVHE